MPLLLFNLDNTLLDRAGAFRAWAEEFLAEIGAPVTDVDWLVDMDADGLTSAWDVAEAVKSRYALSEPAISLKEAVQEGPVAFTRADPLIACALRIATNAGWVPVIVSNGEARIQEAKIQHAGLDSYVAGWVISQEAGVSKPNPRIFEIAAQRARGRLAGAWVVGDGPETDIGGAAELRLPSVWLHRGRSWGLARFAPTRSADSVIGAVATILDTVRAAGPHRGPAALPGPRPLDAGHTRAGSRQVEPPAERPRAEQPPAERPPVERPRVAGRPAQPRLAEPQPARSHRPDPHPGDVHDGRDGGVAHPGRSDPYRAGPYPVDLYPADLYRDDDGAMYPRSPQPRMPAPGDDPYRDDEGAMYPRSPQPRMPALGVAPVNARRR